MKAILGFCGVFLFVGVAYAATPSTSCPSGYTMLSASGVTLAEKSCASGYTSVGEAGSCIAGDSSGNCVMYAPAGTSYTDSVGHTYVYTEVCPLTI